MATIPFVQWEKIPISIPDPDASASVHDTRAVFWFMIDIDITYYNFHEFAGAVKFR